MALKQLAATPKLGGNYPKLVYYYSAQQDKEYLILTPHHMNTTCVWGYDIKENKFSILCQYPDNFGPNCHGDILIPNTNQLYFLCGHNKNVGILNLETLDWSIKNYDHDDSINVPNDCSNPSILYIPDAEIPIHIISVECKIWTYDFRKSIFSPFKDQPPQTEWSGNCPMALYLNYYKKFVIFYENERNALCYDMSKSTETNEWYHFCDFPPDETMRRSHSLVTTAFDGRIIILVEHQRHGKQKDRKGTFWFLDVDQKKWYKSDTTNDFDFIIPQMIKREHLLYVINCSTKQFYCIDLLKVIPPCLMEKCTKRIYAIINGYLSGITQRQDIPKDIVSLISSFAVEF